ncbi:hypothetical protein [Planococcus glaciei]|uniref:hypothetical protein n=1 Tax=Planococcus glaciei TaxID=459472 RepID=UPI001C72F995|nr:hypothetical protein [Planococcus glaciei]MBX0313310.1 hypothetical protein [Planococcus glaciei]
MWPSRIEERPSYSTGAAFITVFFIFSAAYITFSLLEDLDIFFRVFISIFVFILYGMYVLIINEGSLKKPLSQIDRYSNSTDFSAMAKQLSKQTGNETDLNDVQLVKLEGMLQYTNDRVNSYILESALFSGLAFAGFITLITSEKLYLTDITNLISSLKGLFGFLIVFDFSSFWGQLGVFTQDDLFIIILIESLFCTLAFISVIASRLRFSDILEEIEISVKMARSFNDKEEEVVLLNLERNKKLYQNRILVLNQRIEQEIDIANKKLDSIKPILDSIRFIRSFGMLFFFSMIFTSALLINPLLALFVIILSIFVAIVMNIDHARRIKKIRSFNRNLHLPHINPKK